MSFLFSIFDQPKRFFLLISGFCFALLGVGFALQYFVGLTPCPLCVLQRIFFFLIGFTALFGGFFSSGHVFRRVAFGIGIAFFSIIGGSIAARQVWMQHFPPPPGTVCAPPWIISLSDVVANLFHPSVSCVEQGWTLLLLSIPEWSLLSFIFLLCISGIFWYFSWREYLMPKESIDNE